MSRWVIVAAATVGTLALSGAVWSRASERSPVCVRTLTPGYFEPPVIEDVIARAPSPMLLIVNPANGPGASPSSDYRRAIEYAQARGTRVLGYVASTFGARPVDDVRADAARYRDWYGVDGIFLDEVAHDAGRLPYYSALSQSLRKGVLVLNPGMVPAREYFALADLVVTYEGPSSDYARRLALEPEWLQDVPLEQTAHLVYAASRDEAVSLLDAPARAGSLYITSGTSPNPWGAPPPYLREEHASRSSTCPSVS